MLHPELDIGRWVSQISRGHQSLVCSKTIAGAAQQGEHRQTAIFAVLWKHVLSDLAFQIGVKRL